MYHAGLIRCWLSDIATLYDKVYCQRLKAVCMLLGSLPSGAGRLDLIAHVLPVNMHMRFCELMRQLFLGSHSLPIVLGRRTGVPWAQRLCQRCNLHAVHDERHLVFECPAMQCVRDRYPALFGPAKNTMRLFMWQHDILGVAHFIKDCFEVLGALDDVPDDASTSSSSALAAG